MKEKEIEQYFAWVVEVNGGKTYKFTSPAQRGVADRIACLANGTVVMVELKTKKGNLSELQKLFAADMKRLNVPYECLWCIEDVDEFINKYIK